MMSNGILYEQPIIPELELIEVPKEETDHAKLMNAFKRINKKLDNLIEKKKSILVKK